MKLSLMKVVFFYFVGFILFCTGMGYCQIGNLGVGVYVLVSGILAWGFPILSRCYYGELED